MYCNGLVFGKGYNQIRGCARQIPYNPRLAPDKQFCHQHKWQADNRRWDTIEARLKTHQGLKVWAVHYEGYVSNRYVSFDRTTRAPENWVTI